MVRCPYYVTLSTGEKPSCLGLMKGVGSASKTRKQRLLENWRNRAIIKTAARALAIIEHLCYDYDMAANDVIRTRFELPLPPGINQQYATVQGRRVLSKDSRRYKKDVGRAIRRLRVEGTIPGSLVAALRHGFVALFIDFYFETPFRRDLDGGLKITQDAICEALEVNDNRVVDVHLVKRVDPLHPRIEVELEALSDWEFGTEYVYLEQDQGRSDADDGRA